MSSSISLQKLAELVSGVLAVGPADGVITGINSIMDAGPGDATFLGNVRYLPALKTTRATVALVPEDLDVSEAPRNLPSFVSKTPRSLFPASSAFLVRPRGSSCRESMRPPPSPVTPSLILRKSASGRMR
jgi:UDP-3-O-[3-hydroxymyristoyl] glucosamine N-acyltransferase